MPSYHEAPGRARRAFVIVEYRADGGGRMVAQLPDGCHEAKPGETCRLRVGFHRERKTGPCFPVAVMRCATHRRASTLYPPGHVPYGRAAVAPVDSRGELIRSPPALAESQGVPAWGLTLFAAATDAATGSLWPKEAPDRHDPAKQADAAMPEDPRRRRTQGRRLSLAADLLGIAPDLGPKAREAIALALAMPVLELRQAARDLDRATLYRDQGRIIASVLAQLRPARGLGDQLLAAGEIASLWGAPRRWDPGGHEVPWPFPRSVMPA